MKKIKKVVANVGKYTDRQGNEKNRYLTIGALFKRDDGSETVKLDSVPVSTEWDGWLNFYDLEERQQQAPQPAQQQMQQPVLDDDIPFS